MVRKIKFERGQRLRRLLEILFRIQSHPGIRNKQLAKEFGVSERQIYRDINAWESAYVPIDRSNGYRFMQEFYLKPFRFGWAELITIYLSSSTLTFQKGNFLAQNMRMVLEKIEMQLDKDTLKRLTRVKDKILMDVAEFAESGIKEEIFNLINQAIVSRNSLILKYHTMEKGEETEREIDPYALIFRAGTWYLLAYCHLKKGLRTFRVSRIKQAFLTDKSFYIPEEFSVRNEFSKILRVRGGEETKVEVRFDKEVARFIKEVKWLPEQTIKANQDGTVILSGTVSGTEEFKYWVLSWGQYAEVLSPPALRQEIKQVTYNMFKRYK